MLRDYDLPETRALTFKEQFSEGFVGASHQVIGIALYVPFLIVSPLIKTLRPRNQKGLDSSLDS